MKWALWLVGAYLVGSIPFGYLIGRARGVDVRTVGSKNIGATNVFRTVGKGWGLLAFLCDFLKGLLPTLAAVLQHGDYEKRHELLELFDERCKDLHAMAENPWEKANVARGMAEYDPEKDESAADVVRRADQLMYAHKRSQKNGRE